MENSIFINFFGDTPLFRILDFLIENRGLDYSKTEIAKGANIGWSTLYKVWNKLEETQIVRQTRVFGNTKLYKLNEQNPIVQKLIKIEWDLVKKYADVDTQKQMKKGLLATH
jgi:predicted transcriptional regulator